MMQLAKDQFLQFVGRFSLLGVDAGLDKQGLGVDAGLFQQQAEAVVLGRENGLLRRAGKGTDWRRRMRRLVRRHYVGVPNDPQRARSNHALQFSDHLFDA